MSTTSPPTAASSASMGPLLGLGAAVVVMVLALLGVALAGINRMLADDGDSLGAPADTAR